MGKWAWSLVQTPGILSGTWPRAQIRPWAKFGPGQNVGPIAGPTAVKLQVLTDVNIHVLGFCVSALLILNRILFDPI